MIYGRLTVSMICILLGLNACVNPFAPALSDDLLVDMSGVARQNTVDGFFKNFRYAYQFKDTLVYGKLLADDFTFVFRDYNLGIDKSWGRAEDMLSTWGLFNGSTSCDLIWNEAVQTIGDSVLLDITRSFFLTIEINPADIIKVYGRAYIRLCRPTAQDDWKMQRWVDESNY